MKKNSFIKKVSVWMASMLLLSYLSIIATGASGLIEQTLLDNAVNSFVDNATIVEWDTVEDQNYCISDGLTIFIGNNLIEPVIRDKFNKESMQSKNTASQLKSEGLSDVNNQNTYLYMYLKQGDYLGIYSESVLFETGISDNAQKQIIDSLLSEDNVQTLKLDFVWEQIEKKPSLAGSYIAAIRTTSYESEAVLRENVTLRQIANYTPNGSTTSYPLVVYKSENRFTAYLDQANSEEEQLYTIEIESTVYHGSNSVAYTGVAGVYNSTYPKVMVVSGVRAAFINDYPSMDSYADISPKEKDNNINGDVIPVSIGTHTDYIQLDLNTSLTYVGISYSHNPQGTSTVSIMADDGVLNQYSMGTNSFRYVAMAKLISGGEVLSTTAEVSVYYRFINSSNGLTKSYYQQELYYEAMQNN